MYDTTKQETYNFWRVMARHYAGHNTVAFYELFNEPTTYRNQLGPVSWDAWKKSVEEEITLIRAYNPQAIPMVAGFDCFGGREPAYGPAIFKYLESKGISWTVWCFDPEWGPTLIKNWNYDLNASGEAAKAAMHGEPVK